MKDLLYLWRNKLLFLIGIRGLRQYKFTEEDFKHIPDEMGQLGVAKKVLFPNKDCKAYRSDPEKQNRGTETMACVTFSNLKCNQQIVNRMLAMVNNDEADSEIQEIVKIFKHFRLIVDGKANFSDRYIAKLSGTSWSGNNFKKVAQTVRDYGLIPEADYPYVQGWSNYYQRVPQSLVEQGKKILEFIEFNYEYVNQSHYNDAKLYSPVQTSVAHLGRAVNGIYPASRGRKIHAIENDYYEDKKYDGLFDTYPPYDKKVSWNYPLGTGVVFSLQLKKNFNIFNQKEIDEFRIGRGWQFIVLNDDYSTEFTKGVYELKEDGMVKIELPDAVREWILSKKADGKLEGVNVQDFSKLIT